MYSLLNLFLRPSTLVVAALVVAALVQWRRKEVGRASRAIVALLALVLYVISCPLFARFALYSLERYSPPAAEQPQAADVVVVLSGGLVEEHGEYRLATDSLRRCLQGLALYRRAGGCRLIVSGGRANQEAEAPPIAHAMQEFLLEQGVPAGDIVVEDQSRTTHENAALTAKLLDSRSEGKVLLVTDAAHMLRARRCFEKQGVRVVPAACYYRATRFDFPLNVWLPSASALEGTDAAVHEWLGLIWYRVRGYI